MLTKRPTLIDELARYEMPEKTPKIIRDLHDNDALLRGKKVLIVDDDMRTKCCPSKESENVYWNVEDGDAKDRGKNDFGVCRLSLRESNVLSRSERQLCFSRDPK